MNEEPNPQAASVDPIVICCGTCKFFLTDGGDEFGLCGNPKVPSDQKKFGLLKLRKQSDNCGDWEAIK
jgi:hypothetical protein